jgi:hypothetical protein
MRSGTAPKREESARQLVRHAEETIRVYGEKGLPCTVVLCGDFNHDPGRPDWAGDDTFRILLDAGFVWAGQGLPREEAISWLSNGRYPDAAQTMQASTGTSGAIDTEITATGKRGIWENFITGGARASLTILVSPMGFCRQSTVGVDHNLQVESVVSEAFSYTFFFVAPQVTELHLDVIIETAPDAGIQPQLFEPGYRPLALVV